MEKELKKYLGQIVEIIYQGADGQITQRRIELRSISAGIVKAYCMERRAPRLFRIDCILAMHSMRQGARTS